MVQQNTEFYSFYEPCSIGAANRSGGNGSRYESPCSVRYSVSIMSAVLDRLSS